jgi:hypothetical protein
MSEEKYLTPSQLFQRQKQVNLGKRTFGYVNYIDKIPKENRKDQDPQTPDIFKVISKRDFAERVKEWRRSLQKYDDTNIKSKI